MLIKGDLVTIPQGAYIYDNRNHHTIKLPEVVKTKKYGVVVGCMGDDYKVLISDTLYQVNKKFLQLVDKEKCS